MESHLVVSVQVDALVDVDLALVGPIWADQPADKVRSEKGKMEEGEAYNAGQVPQIEPGTCAKSAMTVRARTLVSARATQVTDVAT